MRLMQARHVLTIIAVRDVLFARSFYVAAFGWRQTVDAPGYAELEIPGGMRFGIYARAGFAKNIEREPAALPSGTITPTELYFHVDDLDGAIQRLISAGARSLSGRSIRDWGDEAAYFADPDGNVIVVARPCHI